MERRIPHDHTDSDAKASLNDKPYSANGNAVLGVLSPRQVQIVELVARGMSDKKISGKLNISEETIGWHLKRIYTRCHLHSRAALTARFLQHKRGRGMLEVEQDPPHERGA